MAVYAYLRVSTGKQDGANQRQGIDDFAGKRGLVIDEYIDDEGKIGIADVLGKFRLFAAASFLGYQKT